ncbi:MAG: SGNH/GDSL hydrolase family protein [Thiomonas sp.]|uniref:Lipolytic enzyme, G-D-S-L n=1 Tax=mine drainage metagenome TaxID=410659 RepID=E6PS68_9ZZZZ
MSFPRLALGVLLACSIPLASGAEQLTAKSPDRWVGSWMVAPQAVSLNPAAPGFNRAPTLDGVTVRQIVLPTLSGKALRLRISNRFGTQALRIGGVTVAASAHGAAVRRDTLHEVTFDGGDALSIPAGQALLSDAVALPVVAGKAMTVSFWMPDRIAPTTWHKIASQVNFIAAHGNFSKDASGAAFQRRFTAYLWLDGMDVEVGPSEHSAALVTIGDSITDGMRSTLNANRRWPDNLARRLRAAGMHHLAVLNAGISGNRLLHDSPCYGPSLLQRFSRDALGQPGVRAVILLVGINDINFGFVPPHPGLDCDVPHVKVTAAELIAGYEDLIAQAHAKGVAIYGGTITPASLPASREAIRQAVNAWMHSSGAFDGVIDFDAALRDPAHPARLLPRFDSGDHVHPSDAGYAAMAAAVPIRFLRLAAPSAVGLAEQTR